MFCYYSLVPKKWRHSKGSSLFSSSLCTPKRRTEKKRCCFIFSLFFSEKLFVSDEKRFFGSVRVCKSIFLYCVTQRFMGLKMSVVLSPGLLHVQPTNMYIYVYHVSKEVALKCRGRAEEKSEWISVVPSLSCKQWYNSHKWGLSLSFSLTSVFGNGSCVWKPCVLVFVNPQTRQSQNLEPSRQCKYSTHTEKVSRFAHIDKGMRKKSIHEAFTADPLFQTSFVWQPTYPTKFWFRRNRDSIVWWKRHYICPYKFKKRYSSSQYNRFRLYTFTILRNLYLSANKYAIEKA